MIFRCGLPLVQVLDPYAGQRFSLVDWIAALPSRLLKLPGHRFALRYPLAAPGPGSDFSVPPVDAFHDHRDVCADHCVGTGCRHPRSQSGRLFSHRQQVDCLLRLTCRVSGQIVSYCPARPFSCLNPGYPDFHDARYHAKSVNRDSFAGLRDADLTAWHFDRPNSCVVAVFPARTISVFSPCASLL